MALVAEPLLRGKNALTIVLPSVRVKDFVSAKAGQAASIQAIEAVAR